MKNAVQGSTPRPTQKGNVGSILLIVTLLTLVAGAYYHNWQVRTDAAELAAICAKPLEPGAKEKLACMFRG